VIPSAVTVPVVEKLNSTHCSTRLEKYKITSDTRFDKDESRKDARETLLLMIVTDLGGTSS